VTFCYVYGYTDQVIYCGYTPGYVGCYDFDGVVVFGTGYPYQPWHRNRFFARPYTYGFGARYHAYSGQWGFDFAVGLGGGGHWVASVQGRERGGRWFGYGGYRPALARRDLNAGEAPVAPNRDLYERNVYERRHDVHPDVRVAAAPPVAVQPQIRNDDLRTNNIYTNQNGDIYRRTDAGGWERRDGDQWKPQEPSGEQPQRPVANSPAPENPPRQENPPRNENPPAHRSQSDLDRDYQARQQGENRGHDQGGGGSPPPEQHSSGGGGGGGGGGKK
jgi:hypothetical protein